MAHQSGWSGSAAEAAVAARVEAPFDLPGIVSVTTTSLMLLLLLMLNAEIKSIDRFSSKPTQRTRMHSALHTCAACSLQILLQLERSSRHAETHAFRRASNNCDKRQTGLPIQEQQSSSEMQERMLADQSSATSSTDRLDPYKPLEQERLGMTTQSVARKILSGSASQNPKAQLGLPPASSSSSSAAC